MSRERIEQGIRELMWTEAGGVIPLPADKRSADAAKGALDYAQTRLPQGWSATLVRDEDGQATGIEIRPHPHSDA